MEDVIDQLIRTLEGLRTQRDKDHKRMIDAEADNELLQKSNDEHAAQYRKHKDRIKELEAQLVAINEICFCDICDQQMQDILDTPQESRALTDGEWLHNDGKGRPYEALDTPPKESK